MKHIATQHVKGYYPVTLSECPPLAVIHDEVQYDQGRWYVECGGEGHYFMDSNEAVTAFINLVNFAMDNKA